MRYVKKPVEIEAIQWTGENKEEIKEFVGESAIFCKVKYQNDVLPSHWELRIKTLEGELNASVNDYIIKGAVGEFYPCKPDIFHKTYSSVVEERLNLGEIESIVVTDDKETVVAIIDSERIVEHTGYNVIIDFKAKLVTE